MASTLLNLSLLSVLFAMCHGLFGPWDFVPRETGCFVPFSSLEEIFCQVEDAKTIPNLDAMLGRVSTRMAIPLVLRGHANALQKASEVKIIRFRAFANLAIGKSLSPFTALTEVSMKGMDGWVHDAVITIDPEAFKNNNQISLLSFSMINLQADFEQLLAPVSSSLQSLTMNQALGNGLNVAAGLKKLTKLNKVYIDSILGEVPDFSASGATLTRLELSHNKINGTLKAESLRDLVNLNRLDLSSNKLDSVEPDAFSTLTKLDWMELQYNKISNFTPEVFKNNQELTYLDISSGSEEGGNPSPGVDCKSVRKMLPKLRALSVGQYDCIYDPQTEKLLEGTLGIMDILGGGK